MSEKICPIMTRCNNPKEDLSEGHIVPCPKEKCQLWVEDGRWEQKKWLDEGHCGLINLTPPQR